jgi:hypothetical protein
MAHKAMTAWLESPWFKYYAIHSPLTTKQSSLVYHVSKLVILANADGSQIMYYIYT